MALHKLLVDDFYDDDVAVNEGITETVDNSTRGIRYPVRERRMPEKYKDFVMD